MKWFRLFHCYFSYRIIQCRITGPDGVEDGCKFVIFLGKRLGRLEGQVVADTRLLEAQIFINVNVGLDRGRGLGCRRGFRLCQMMTGRSTVVSLIGWHAFSFSGVYLGRQWGGADNGGWFRFRGWFCIDNGA